MTNLPDNSRRKFLATAGTLTVAGFTPGLAHHLILPKTKKRQFKLCLNPGIIGVKATQEELLDMAVNYGYEAIISMPNQLAEWPNDTMQAFLRKMKKHKISWGSTNLPVEFRKDEDTFRADLAKLPAAVKALEKAGATRMNTWILNASSELTYTANFKQHADRLRECAKILGQHGVRLGLEYVAPKTSMLRRKYPFMRTMAETRELIAAIGEPNMGLVLDSFHWFCAEDTPDDIRALSKDDIVTCDINDARSDLSRDEQVDGTRELPGATGMIDLKPFLQALIDIGYDGPVRSEPFNKALNEMEDTSALKMNYEAMRKAFALVE